MLHASDVEALQAAKEQVAKNSAIKQQLEDAAQKAESALRESRASWEEQERTLKVWFSDSPGPMQSSPSGVYLVSEMSTIHLSW